MPLSLVLRASAVLDLGVGVAVACRGARGAQCFRSSNRSLHSNDELGTSLTVDVTLHMHRMYYLYCGRCTELMSSCLVVGVAFFLALAVLQSVLSVTTNYLSSGACGRAIDTASVLCP